MAPRTRSAGSKKISPRVGKAIVRKVSIPPPPPIREIILRGRTIQFSEAVKVKKEPLTDATDHDPNEPNLLKQDDDNDECCVILAIGEIVFGKVKGFAHWPAKILEVPVNLKSKNLSYKVQFFVTNEVRSVPGRNIIFFTEENVKSLISHRFKGKKLTQLYTKAIIVAKDEINMRYEL